MHVVNHSEAILQRIYLDKIVVIAWAITTILSSELLHQMCNVGNQNAVLA